MDLKLAIYEMNNIYIRIISGREYDEFLRPYSISDIEKLNKYFESKEEFEKCIVLKTIINNKKFI